MVDELKQRKTISLTFSAGVGDPELIDDLLDRVADLFEACGGEEIKYTWESWCKVTASLFGSVDSLKRFAQSAMEINHAR